MDRVQGAHGERPGSHLELKTNTYTDKKTKGYSFFHKRQYTGQKKKIAKNSSLNKTTKSILKTTLTNNLNNIACRIAGIINSVIVTKTVLQCVENDEIVSNNADITLDAVLVKARKGVVATNTMREGCGGRFQIERAFRFA